MLIKGLGVPVKALAGALRGGLLPASITLSNAALQGSIGFAVENPVVEIEGGEFEVVPDYGNLAKVAVPSGIISFVGLKYAQRRIQFADRLGVILECLDLIDDKMKLLTSKRTAAGFTNIQEASPLERIQDAVRTLKTSEDPATLGIAQITLNDALRTLSDEAGQLGALYDAVLYANNPLTAGLSLPAGVEEGLKKLPMGVRIEAPLLNELINNPKKFAVSKADLEMVQDIASFFYKDSFYNLSNFARSAFDIRNELSQIKAGSFAFLDELPEVLDTAVPGVKVELEPYIKQLREGKIGQQTTNLTVKMQSTSLMAQSSIADVKSAVKKARYTKIIRVLGVADLLIWGATGVVDVLLDWVGIDEEDQRIPWIADIPVIGRLFDLSVGFGTSLTDAFIIDPLFGLIPDEAFEGLSDIISFDFPAWQFALLAILDWFIKEVNFTGDIQLAFGSREPTEVRASVPLPRLEPLDALALFTVACVGKIVVKGWVIPAWRAFTTTAGLSKTA